MGRTYTPANSELESFDVNFAGVSLLGHMHKFCEAPIAPAKYDYDQENPNTPYTLDHAGCLETVEKLQSKSPDEWLEFLLETGSMYWGGNSEEFLEFLQDWVDFLLSCGGYQVPC